MFHIIHHRRGATAFEFTLILFPLLMLLCGVFDLSRYALTWYSVGNLADEAMRRQIICFSPLIAQNVKSVPCVKSPLTTAEMKIVAPALFWGDLNTPTVDTDRLDADVSKPRKITASVTGFKAVMSLIPYPDTLTVNVNLPF